MIRLAVGIEYAMRWGPERCTRSELARRIGRSPSFVTRLMSGEKNASLVTVEAIAAALHVRPWQLLLWSEYDDGARARGGEHG